jgi:hypothetical protein
LREARKAKQIETQTCTRPPLHLIFCILMAASMLMDLLRPQAIQKGNMDGARIYAENAIREKNQSLCALHPYLCSASRVYGGAGMCVCAFLTPHVTNGRAGTT